MPGSCLDFISGRYHRSWEYVRTGRGGIYVVVGMWIFRGRFFQESSYSESSQGRLTEVREKRKVLDYAWIMFRSYFGTILPVVGIRSHGGWSCRTGGTRLVHHLGHRLSNSSERNVEGLSNRLRRGVKIEISVGLPERMRRRGGEEGDINLFSNEISVVARTATST